jgi:hypothetical protein
MMIWRLFGDDGGRLESYDRLARLSNNRGVSCFKYDLLLQPLADLDDSSASHAYEKSEAEDMDLGSAGRLLPVCLS